MIPSNLVRILVNATKPVFGLLTSAMHMSWLRHIGGRLKSDYRYSIGLVYNNFPMPPVSGKKLASLTPFVEAVLESRNKYPEEPLSNLYDPDLMPPNLRRAHQALDRAVDRLYRARKFVSDRERAEHLLRLYENISAPLLATEKRKRRRLRRVTQ